jgi:hypothetical protein
MNVTEVLILAGIGVLALTLLSPSTIPDLIGVDPVEGQEITISGVLEYRSNPPLGQIVLPVMVWGVQEYVLEVDSPPLYFSGFEGNFYYLARDGHVIVSLDGFAVGDRVTVRGVVVVEEDVNLNKLYLLEYTELVKR